MSGRFFDSNVILYLLDDGPKRAIATELLAERGTISVQVLNEVLVNCRRKAGMDWEEAGAFLTGIRDLCYVVDLTAKMHDVGRALGSRYRLQVYDAMIAGAALVAGCDVLLSEDMQDGLVLEGALTIHNPFAEAWRLIAPGSRYVGPIVSLIGPIKMRETMKDPPRLHLDPQLEGRPPLDRLAADLRHDADAVFQTGY